MSNQGTEYLILREESAPTFYLGDTTKVIEEYCEETIQGYWVALYNHDEQYVEEYIEQFPTYEKALEYKISLEVKNA